MAEVYTCPMHSDVQQEGPGLCPVCGMALEPVSVSQEENNPEYREMLHRFWFSVVFALPVLLLAMLPLIPEKASQWVQLALASPVVLWAGWPFFERGWYSIINRSLNMFTLIAMGVGTSYLYSLLVVLTQQDAFVYFEAAAVITTLVLLGQVLELKAKGQTSSAIKALLNRTPKTAHLIIDGQEREVAIDQVKVGDILRVKPGENIPVDGIVTEGSSAVDESMISGESLPIVKSSRDQVSGGTINQTGSFLMQAEHVGSETLLARIVQMVSDAQRSKASIQRLADIVSGYFVPAVIFIALLTGAVWYMMDSQYALSNAVAVLIIACPCALGLATPMSIMVGVGRGAEMGILIKNADALERLEKVQTLVIDKTGTLTEGKPQLQNYPDNEILRLAASLEQHSEHPLALAVMQAARDKQLQLTTTVTDFISVPGSGIKGIVDGKSIQIGNAKFLNLNEVASDKTTLYVSVDGKLVATLLVTDPIKQSAPGAINSLHRLGLKVIMLTGDNQKIAQSVGKKLSIDEIYAEVGPADKNAMIRKLKQEGQSVAMAGDGVNDAPALAEADVGIAMSTGTDVAIESAGITLLKGDLGGIVKAIALSRATMRNIRQNLFFAFLYNALGVPIAAGILFPFTGLLLNPMIASLAMSLSSVSVIANALRLKKWT